MPEKVITHCSVRILRASQSLASIGQCAYNCNRAFQSDTVLADICGQTSHHEHTEVACAAAAALSCTATIATIDMSEKASAGIGLGAPVLGVTGKGSCHSRARA